MRLENVQPIIIEYYRIEFLNQCNKPEAINYLIVL